MQTRRLYTLQAVDPKEPLDLEASPKLSKKLATQYAFIDGAIKYLRIFHDIKGASASDVRLFSGMPHLEHHLQYVCETKVDDEIVNNVIWKCDEAFKALNAKEAILSLIEGSERAKADMEEFSRLMQDFAVKAGRITEKVRVMSDERELSDIRLRLRQAIDDSERIIIDALKSTCKVIVKDASISEYDVERAYNGQSTKNLRHINSKMAEAAAELSDKFATSMRQTAENLNSSLVKSAERILGQVQQEISEEFERVKEKLRGNVTAMSIIDSFAVSAFAPSLSKLGFKSGDFVPAMLDDSAIKTAAKAAHTTRTESRTERRERNARGFWEHLMFWKNYYERVTVNDKVDDYSDIKTFRSALVQSLEKNFIERMIEIIKDVAKAAERDVRDVFADIARQCEQISGQHIETFSSISRDIKTAIDTKSAERQSLLNDKNLLEEIFTKLKPLMDMWSEIKNKNRKEGE